MTKQILTDDGIDKIAALHASYGDKFLLKHYGIHGDLIGDFARDIEKAVLKKIQKQEDFLLIPIDQKNGKPKITNGMKAECIGEFNFTEEMHLPDEEGEIEEREVSFVVHWDTCKDIYKMMAVEAAKNIEKP